MSGQQHAPAALYLPGKTRYPFYRRLGGPQGRSGRAEYLVPTGIRSPDRPARSQALYRLSHRARILRVILKGNLPFNLPWRHRGGVDVKLHCFFNFGAVWGGFLEFAGLRRAPAAYLRERDPVPIAQEAGWAPGPVWTGVENITPHRDSIPVGGFRFVAQHLNHCATAVPPSFIILYYDQQIAQLFHKLSHSYMFRHYRVILRQLVINTLPSYTSISNAAVGNTIYN